MTTSASRSGRRAPRSFAILLPLLVLAAPAVMAQEAHPAIGAAASPLDAEAAPLQADAIAAIVPAAVAATAAAAPAPAAAKAGEQDAPQPARIQSVLKRALALLGTPYRWGGTTTAGFDCSGLVGYVFRTTLGIELPRVSRDMAKTGEVVERSHMSPGDLVFFGRRGRVDHVGIYLGGGRFVHAPRTGRDVTVSSLEDGYWGRKFLEARRIVGV